ncbi:hypothetical protein [Micromonospora ureilytica]|uniref:hypothetical protein n=1 Tax=Micromonospora ureilytica TaxID=709868 RepID=UPI00142E39BE|nr:hypothetical protein [Micromonospora ureilytica]
MTAPLLPDDDPAQRDAADFGGFADEIIGRHATLLARLQSDATTAKGKEQVRRAGRLWS